MAVLRLGSGTRTWVDKYLRRAIAFSGLTQDQMGFIADDFENGYALRWTASNTGTGATGNVNTYVGGVTRATSGGTNGGVGSLIYGTATGSPSAYPALVGSGQTAKWYMFGRVYLVNTVDAQGEIWMGLRNQSSGAEALRAGAIGPSSTTKFAAVFDTGVSATLTSTISIGASAWFTIEVWMDGTTTYLSVNDEVPVTSTAANLSGKEGPMLLSRNGTTSSGRAGDWDRLLLAYPQGA